MERSELAITKLIILYIIRSLPAVTLSQLTALALDTLYMDYFGFATAYEGLRNDQMIAASFRDDDPARDAAGQAVIRCDLTAQGRAILENARAQKSPPPIRSYLAQASTSWQKDIRLERQLTARYESDGKGQYRVSLSQSEGEKSWWTWHSPSRTNPWPCRSATAGNGCRKACTWGFWPCCLMSRSCARKPLWLRLSVQSPWILHIKNSPYASPCQVNRASCNQPDNGLWEPSCPAEIRTKTRIGSSQETQRRCGFIHSDHENTPLA